MKSIARILCCFMFLSVIVVSAADAGDSVYMQSCARASDKGFVCGSVTYSGIDDLSISYLESVLVGYGCSSLGKGMYWCSISSSSLAQASGYSLGIMSTVYSTSNIYMLYVFAFN